MSTATYTRERKFPVLYVKAEDISWEMSSWKRKLIQSCADLAISILTSCNATDRPSCTMILINMNQPNFWTALSVLWLWFGPYLQVLRYMDEITSVEVNLSLKSGECKHCHYNLLPDQNGVFAVPLPVVEMHFTNQVHLLLTFCVEGLACYGFWSVDMHWDWSI